MNLTFLNSNNEASSQTFDRSLAIKELCQNEQTGDDLLNAILNETIPPKFSVSHPDMLNSQPSQIQPEQETSDQLDMTLHLNLDQEVDEDDQINSNQIQAQPL